MRLASAILLHWVSSPELPKNPGYVRLTFALSSLLVAISAAEAAGPGIFLNSVTCSDYFGSCREYFGSCRKYLGSCGIDLSASDANGWTPATIAAYNGRLPVIE